MLNPMDQNEMFSTLLDSIKEQQNEAIEKMLGDAIKKGIITVRQSDPMLFLERSPDSAEDKVILRHSLVIDYLGAEKIEQLEKDLEYMKKINSDLHTSLAQFYEKTKVNTWLKK